MSLALLVAKACNIVINKLQITEKMLTAWPIPHIEIYQENINYYFNHQWPLLLTWIDFNPSMDK